MNRIVNPLMGPERSHPYRLNRVGVPVNVPTRGYPTGYQQVGVLIEENSNGENKLLPLLESRPIQDQDNGDIIHLLMDISL